MKNCWVESETVTSQETSAELTKSKGIRVIPLQLFLSAEPDSFTLLMNEYTTATTTSTTTASLSLWPLFTGKMEEMQLKWPASFVTASTLVYKHFWQIQPPKHSELNLLSLHSYTCTYSYSYTVTQLHLQFVKYISDGGLGEWKMRQGEWLVPNEAATGINKHMIDVEMSEWILWLQVKGFSCFFSFLGLLVLSRVPCIPFKIKSPKLLTESLGLVQGCLHLHWRLLMLTGPLEDCLPCNHLPCFFIEFARPLLSLSLSFSLLLLFPFFCFTLDTRERK